jgi:hypothetical protein
VGTADTRPVRPATATGRPRPGGCQQWLPGRSAYCGLPARPYRIGECCPAHPPAALAARPEAVPGPGYTPQSSKHYSDRLARAAARRAASTAPPETS